MRYQILYVFALFPFLHTTSYPAELVKCSQEQILLSSNSEEIEVSLFNTKIIDDDGWKKACSLLEDASSIRFEIDPSSKIEEPIPVYLFVNDTLVQEELMKLEYAYPMIRNPEYTYEKQLEEAYDSTKTIANAVVEQTEHSSAMVAPLYVLGIAMLWILMVFRFVWKRKSKKTENT